MQLNIKNIIGKSFVGLFLFFLLSSLAALLVLALREKNFPYWEHMLSFELPIVVRETFILVSSVSLLSLFLGLFLGGLVDFYDFPLRKHFERLFILPLAIPPYVMAFLTIGLYDGTGLIQNFFRELNPDFGFYNIRNGLGLTLSLSFSLFPYMFLMVRSGLKTVHEDVVDSAEVLGAQGLDRWTKLLIPTIKPWIAAGLLFIMFEVLSDFGAVSLFNYRTFTTAIYKSWFGFFSIGMAVRFAIILFFIAFFIHYLEAIYQKKRIAHFEIGSKKKRRRELGPFMKPIATVICSLFFLVTFLLPIFLLFKWSLFVDGDILKWSLQSIGLAFVGTIVLFVLAFCGIFLSQERIWKHFLKILQFGYAIPGTVLALAFFLSSEIFIKYFNLERTFFISLCILILAIAIRFFLLFFRSLVANYQNIDKSLFESSILLKPSTFSQFFNFYFPLLKTGFIAGTLLTFIEILKELPMTLMMRPFGFETLSVKVFEYTSEGEWERAAFPSLVIVLMSLVPVYQLVQNRHLRG